MDLMRTDVLIVEQALLLIVLLWFGRRWGKWTKSRDRLTERTEALIVELQKHRGVNVLDAAHHVATFIHEDREESA